jgi:excisionase family DNA binding protein
MTVSVETYTGRRSRMDSTTSHAPGRPLATRREVARFLGVPEGTVEQWGSRGGGPAYIRVGRHVRYRWSDVERWLATREVAS